MPSLLLTLENMRNIVASNTAEEFVSSGELDTLKQQCVHVCSSKFETTLKTLIPTW